MPSSCSVIHALLVLALGEGKDRSTTQSPWRWHSGTGRVKYLDTGLNQQMFARLRQLERLDIGLKSSRKHFPEDVSATATTAKATKTTTITTKTTIQTITTPPEQILSLLLIHVS